jgi:hypothetical protein
LEAIGEWQGNKNNCIQVWIGEGSRKDQQAGGKLKVDIYLYGYLVIQA